MKALAAGIFASIVMAADFAANALNLPSQNGWDQSATAAFVLFAFVVLFVKEKR